MNGIKLGKDLQKRLQSSIFELVKIEKIVNF